MKVTQIKSAPFIGATSGLMVGGTILFIGMLILPFIFIPLGLIVLVLGSVGGLAALWVTCPNCGEEAMCYRLEKRMKCKMCDVVIRIEGKKAITR